MAKGTKGAQGGSRGPSSSSSSVPRWEKVGDIPMDEEDDFHHNRDKVLLEGQSDDDDDSDIGADQREVLGLAGSDLEDSDEDDGDVSEDDDESGEGSSSKKPRQYKRLEKEKLAREAAPLSDDEDVQLSDSGDEDIARWGSNKRAYYNTNDLDEMDSDSEIDEEEARRLELDEVKKLQAKTRRGMEDSDFGLGEADELGGAEEGGKGVKDRERRRAELDGLPNGDQKVSQVAVSSAPSVQELPADPLARASLLVQLQKTSPETIALAGEYADAVDQMIRIKSALPEFERNTPQHKGLGMIHMHYQALATYITTLTFYFHLRASPRYASQPALLSGHPILERILKLKEGLTNMEDLGFALPTEEEMAEDEADESEIEDDLEALWSGRASSTSRPRNFFAPDEGEEDEEQEELGDLDEDELAQLVADAKASSKEKRKAKVNGNADRSTDTKKDLKKKKKRTEGNVSVSSNNGKKKEKKKASEAPLAGLVADLSSDSLNLAPHTGKRKHAVPSTTLDTTSSNGESYGEATSLSTSELEDKANKKRSLRFYTGQMDATAARREAGARERMGGDNDIPYRDRERSRLAVEQAKAAKESKLNGTAKHDTALDGEEWGEGDTRDWRDVMGVAGQGAQTAGTEDDGDDYYDLVAGGKKEAKRARKEEYDAERDASRIIEETSLDPGTHRSLTRQIATNRGLTPHRKQDRNLRVKKRKKYEKAQKKLSSTRAVYTGGQGSLQGGYSGESSGINTGVAKSRRFAN